jgi:hypothetical protein
VKRRERQERGREELHANDRRKKEKGGCKREKGSMGVSVARKK